MDKRFFLKHISLGLFAPVIFHGRDHHPFKITYLAKSKDSQMCDSVDDFYYKNYVRADKDSYFYYLNYTRKKRSVLSYKAKLLSNKTTLEVEKIYTSREAQREDFQLWARLFPRYKSQVRYTIINIV